MARSLLYRKSRQHAGFNRRSTTMKAIDITDLETITGGTSKPTNNSNRFPFPPNPSPWPIPRPSPLPFPPSPSPWPQPQPFPFPGPISTIQK
jgi:hypothetical protein